jgi:hypothetical protein
MSERSTFVSDSIAYFADRDSVAAALMEHLSAFEPVLITSSGAPWAVAGVARSSWAGGEWEDFKGLPPFEYDVAILINCEGGQAIRVNLKTGEFANV